MGWINKIYIKNKKFTMAAFTTTRRTFTKYQPRKQQQQQQDTGIPAWHTLFVWFNQKIANDELTISMIKDEINRYDTQLKRLYPNKNDYESKKNELNTIFMKSMIKLVGKHPKLLDMWKELQKGGIKMKAIGSNGFHIIDTICWWPNDFPIEQFKRVLETMYEVGYNIFSKNEQGENAIESLIACYQKNKITKEVFEERYFALTTFSDNIGPLMYSVLNKSTSLKTKLNQKRMEHKMTLEMLNKKTGIPVEVLRAFELGTQIPSEKALQILSQALSTNLSNNNDYNVSMLLYSLNVNPNLTCETIVTFLIKKKLVTKMKRNEMTYDCLKLLKDALYTAIDKKYEPLLNKQNNSSCMNLYFQKHGNQLIELGIQGIQKILLDCLFRIGFTTKKDEENIKCELINSAICLSNMVELELVDQSMNKEFIDACINFGNTQNIDDKWAIKTIGSRAMIIEMISRFLIQKKYIKNIIPIEDKACLKYMFIKWVLPTLKDKDEQKEIKPFDNIDKNHKYMIMDIIAKYTGLGKKLKDSDIINWELKKQPTVQQPVIQQTTNQQPTDQQPVIERPNIKLFHVDLDDDEDSIDDAMYDLEKLFKQHSINIVAYSVLNNIIKIKKESTVSKIFIIIKQKISLPILLEEANILYDNDIGQHNETKIKQLLATY